MGAILHPKGHQAIPGDIFGCHKWDVGCGLRYWNQTDRGRDTAQYPTMHRKYKCACTHTPTTTNPAPNVNKTEVEKPCLNLRSSGSHKDESKTLLIPSSVYRETR